MARLRILSTLSSLHPGIAPHLVRCGSPQLSIGHRYLSCSSYAAQHRHPTFSTLDPISISASRPAAPIPLDAPGCGRGLVLDVQAPNTSMCGSHSTSPMPNRRHGNACDPCSGGCLTLTSLHHHPLKLVVWDEPWPSTLRVHISMRLRVRARLFVCV